MKISQQELDALIQKAREDGEKGIIYPCPNPSCSGEGVMAFCGPYAFIRCTKCLMAAEPATEHGGGKPIATWNILPRYEVQND